MTLKGTILSLVATLCALPTGPLHAQALGGDYAVKFTTSFPFYVSGRMMPAGSYVMTQPNLNSDLVRIRDTDSSHSAFILYTPILSTEPFSHGGVSFRQYGDTYYLSDVMLAGAKAGLTVPESSAEKRSARASSKMASVRTVALQSNVRG